MTITLTNQTRNGATLTNQSRSVNSFMLKEDAFYLLLESGGHIVLEPVSGFYPTNEVKH